jgi:hypothetical protein
LNRRQFVSALAAPIAWAACPGAFAASASPAIAPFHVLYGNDATNITSCTSPWHKHGEAFQPAMLEATVDEVAGTAVDAHLLQPGLCTVPWWPSKVDPLPEHFEWIKRRFGLKPDSFGRYLLAGGDLVQVFIDRCRRRGQSPFISFRLNDGHAKSAVHSQPGEKVPTSAQYALSRFYYDHPEYRLGPDPRDWKQLVQNWGIREVREHKFALVEELCTNYDLDGLELDFMRHPYFFPTDRTTSDERLAIMTEFVSRVRALLDRTARGGRRRWLSVRIPAYLAAHEPLGIQPQAFAQAGVDIFNLSCFYFTEQQTDAAQIRKLVPSAAVYLEMTPATYAGPALDKTGGSDNYSFRRTTDEQFYTTAHAALARGLTGVSLFNFAYYREHGSPERGPFCEPPFDVLKHLADANWLARQPQDWFLAHVWDEPFVPDRPLGNRRKPRKVSSGETATFTLDLAAPAGGWKNPGVLRIESKQSQREATWRVTLNGGSIAASEKPAEPSAKQHLALLSPADHVSAWVAPAAQLREGPNRLQLKLSGGGPLELIFIDLAAG